MPGKTQIKYIQSLRQKKYRHLHRLYVIEGEKIVHDYLMQDYPVCSIYAVEEWLRDNAALLRTKKLPCTVVTPGGLKRLSSLATPHKVIALAKMPETAPPPGGWAPLFTSGLHLALHAIQDPGNLGTIIRTADWFGIDTIVCSEDCADAFNPKVVQAAMGSLARVRIIYDRKFFSEIRSLPLPVYATTLHGENIFTEKFPAHAVILIGNESKGLPEVLLKAATRQITIPRYGKAESLNAAVAAGIVMAWFRGSATS